MKTKEVDDQVIVFASGHGLLDKNLEIFTFVLMGYRFRNPENRGISFDDMEDLLDSIPARKKLLMVDACHSSGKSRRRSGTELVAMNVEKTDDIIPSGGNVREYNFRELLMASQQSREQHLDNSFELMQETFWPVLIKGPEQSVISAAAGKGYASGI
ncbi:MAG: aminotransferase class I/II-fold pyridoxal phosphate-dependent enzyme [Marinilabiliales bacterium]|nr:aminotransferase class I/II-fold pyridoxal phosphate-dependent enzyme [Marinilabiliales bacterium]